MPRKTIKVTEKHIDEVARLTAEAMRERGEFAMGEAVKQAIGQYADPSKFFQRYKKNFLERLEKYLPEKEVMKQHKKLMKARQLKIMHMPADIDDEVIRKAFRNLGFKIYHITTKRKGKTTYKVVVAVAPTVQTQIKAIELYYQVSGRYVIKHEVNDLRDFPDEQLDEIIEGEAVELLDRYNQNKKLPNPDKKDKKKT